jgi:hypothetical protein
MALQDWAPTVGDRVRLRHDWPDRDLRRGDVGTVVDVATRVFGETAAAAADRRLPGAPPLALEVGAVQVRWDRLPEPVVAVVQAQLEPA